ncbi:MAG: YvcK family protein [Candidatus Omnitrophica bacterium]|nr:YvcK family protein [Candidatus Omnitrophota bacterium]
MSTPKTILVAGMEDSAAKSVEILAPLGFAVFCTGERGMVRELVKKQTVQAVLYFADEMGGADFRQDALLAEIAASHTRFIMVSAVSDPDVIREALRGGAVDWISMPLNHREFIARVVAVLTDKLKVSCIGGGTGLFNLRVGLKTLPNILLHSVVSMTDDGGSSGRLRSDFGILPPGDIRRSLVALSNAPELMNQVIGHRFRDGADLGGA